MKKLMLSLIAFVAVACVSRADSPISADQLPAAAQEFIKANYSGVEVAFATIDNDFADRDYEVHMANGTKIKFDRNGQWTEIKTQNGAIPTSALPPAIRTYAAKTHPNSRVIEIERDRKGYEIKLSSGEEIKFNDNFMVIDYDF